MTRWLGRGNEIRGNARMAEWTGRKRTLNSIDVELDPPPQLAASDRLAPPPEAPGAIASPQIPGMTPDDPDLPGRPRGSLPPLASNRRPLTEYGTAQRLLRLFSPPGGAELTAADWEQGASAHEELRKADPALLAPFRPLGGTGLGIGRAQSAIATEALAALGDATAVTQVVTPQEAAATAPVAAPEPSTASTIEIPAGAVRGDGTAVCPDGFPVKGNAQSKIYHVPASRQYGATIPELCFATAEAAEAAGFRAPKNL
jgi:hypothetical protein